MKYKPLEVPWSPLQVAVDAGLIMVCPSFLAYLWWLAVRQNINKINLRCIKNHTLRLNYFTFAYSNVF